MTAFRFIAMPTDTARAFQNGALDANGQPPERHIADGPGLPCRHCLADIAAGEPYLILAYRPFPEPQPYAEVGPIFLHAEPCRQSDPSAEAPAMFLDRDHLLVRGYGENDRIRYGTGQVVESADVARTAASLLERLDIAYVHIRSASNNCYQCRVERAVP